MALIPQQTYVNCKDSMVHCNDYIVYSFTNDKLIIFHYLKQYNFSFSDETCR